MFLTSVVMVFNNHDHIDHVTKLFPINWLQHQMWHTMHTNDQSINNQE
jgi:hypothetical protein